MINEVVEGMTYLLTELPEGDQWDHIRSLDDTLVIALHDVNGDDVEVKMAPGYEDHWATSHKGSFQIPKTWMHRVVTDERLAQVEADLRAWVQEGNDRQFETMEDEVRHPDGRRMIRGDLPQHGEWRNVSQMRLRHALDYIDELEERHG